MKLLILLFVVFTVLSTVSTIFLEQKPCANNMPRLSNEEHASKYALYFKRCLPMVVWMIANRPNYNINVDMRFPYSELPHLGEYDLVKIPASLDDLIKHVDYWGEGKVVSEKGVRGFSSCYNVNHQYQLVSSGPDQDRKIPNRIPVISENDCDTSGYVKDNSVLTVTVAAANITRSCAKDIARLVNKDHGKVVVFGVHDNSQEILELAVELNKKGLTSLPNATLASELQGLTYYDSYVTFLTKRDLGVELYNNVILGNYDVAVNIIQSELKSELINELITRLVSATPRNIMSFAYKLWFSGAKDIVRNHFPYSFQHIFNEDTVTIVNQRYQIPVKLAYEVKENDTLAKGDYNLIGVPYMQLSWKVLPVWNSDGVRFKLYNTEKNMYLKLGLTVDNDGDRKCWGSPNSNEDRHLYYLEPLDHNGTVLFFIVNYQYGQALKMSLYKDQIGHRIVWGHNGSEYNKDERFMWEFNFYPLWTTNCDHDESRNTNFRKMYCNF